MSGLYDIRNGAQYFLSPPEDFAEDGEPEGGSDMVVRGVTLAGDQISEYLNCFQLFGYDSKGRPVKLSRVSSYMEYTAIAGLIKDEMEKDEMEKWATMDIYIGDDDDIDQESE